MRRSIISIFLCLLLISLNTSCNTINKRSSQNNGMQTTSDSEEEYMPLVKKSLELIKEEKNDEALSLLKKAQKIAPDKYLVNLVLGNVYFKKKEYKKALDLLEKATEIDPNESGPYFLIGCCYYQFNDYEKAEINLSKYLEKNNDPSAMMLLGLTYAREHKKEQAIESLNMVKEIDPTMATQIDRLISLIEKDDYEKFLEFINKMEANQ